MNALTYNIKTGQVEDWTDGKKALSDLANNRLCLTSPNGFDKEPFRMFRIIKFAAKYQMTIGAREWKLLLQKNGLRKRVQENPERLYANMYKICTLESK